MSPKRRFMQFAGGVPLWQGPGMMAHCAFHRSVQTRHVAAAMDLLIKHGRPWAMGWEGNKFVLSWER